MSFLAPLNLLWLVPTLGGIVALWILRMRRKDYAVSSLFLWRDVTPAQKADTPFQRLRSSLLLILQLLAAFLLIVALSGPVLPVSSSGHRSYVLILDNSVTMGATDVSPSRQDNLETLAADYAAKRLGAGDRLCVVSTSPSPTVVSDWGASLGEVQRAIKGVLHTDTVRDLGATMTLASGILDRSHPADGRIDMFTDCSWPDDEDKAARIAAKIYPITLFSVGTDNAPNVGVASIDFRTDPTQVGRKRVLVRLRNFGVTDARQGQVDIFAGPGTRKTIPLAIKRGDYQSVTFDVPMSSTPLVATATISGVSEDCLKADNSASVVIPAARQYNVLLVSSGNVFLEQLLTGDKSCDVFECNSGQYSSAVKARAYDTVVFDGWLPEAIPEGKYLVFNAVNRDMPVALADASPSLGTEIVDWNQTHPIMRFVDFTDVHIAAQTQSSPSRWGRSLVDTSSGPAVVVGERDGRRIVWVSFSLSDSDFPLKVAFPVFVQNTLQWLRDTGAGERSLATGTPLPSFPAGKWTVTGPDGLTSGICAEGDASSCVFKETGRAGIYRAQTGVGAASYAVNVASDRGSNLARGIHSNLSQAPVQDKRATSVSRLRLTQLLTLAVLFLLLIEWLAYHRKRS
ncbi:MAG TPA: VWA domain-containing protein [Capsulimonadaceae bacterium]|jgi:hypothetical protein